MSTALSKPLGLMKNLPGSSPINKNKAAALSGNGLVLAYKRTGKKRSLKLFGFPGGAVGLLFLRLYSTVTDFARFLGLSMSQPFSLAA